MIGELYEQALGLTESLSSSQWVDSDWDVWGKLQSDHGAIRIVASFIYRNLDQAKLLEPGEFTQFMALLNKACQTYNVSKSENFAAEVWEALRFAPRL